MKAKAKELQRMEQEQQRYCTLRRFIQGRTVRLSVRGKGVDGRNGSGFKSGTVDRTYRNFIYDRPADVISAILNHFFEFSLARSVIIFS